MPPYKPDRRALIRFIAAPFVVCGVLALPGGVLWLMGVEDVGESAAANLAVILFFFALLCAPVMTLIGWPTAFWLLRRGRDGYSAFALAGFAAGVPGALMMLEFLRRRDEDVFLSVNAGAVVSSAIAGAFCGLFLSMAFRLVSGVWRRPLQSAAQVFT